MNTRNYNKAELYKLHRDTLHSLNVGEDNTQLLKDIEREMDVRRAKVTEILWKESVFEELDTMDISELTPEAMDELGQLKEEITSDLYFLYRG